VHNTVLLRAEGPYAQNVNVRVVRDPNDLCKTHLNEVASLIQLAIELIYQNNGQTQTLLAGRKIRREK
jgi:hypothetical protein